MNDEQDNIPDPAAAKNVAVVITSVVETYAGTFSVTAHDIFGTELFTIPIVPDAEDWGDALIRSWIEVRKEVRKHNAAGSN